MSDEKSIEGHPWYGYSEKEFNDKWEAAIEKFKNSLYIVDLGFNVKTGDKTTPEGDTTLNLDCFKGSKSIYDGFPKYPPYINDESGQYNSGKAYDKLWNEVVPKMIKTYNMKKRRFTFDRSKGFVLGVAIDGHEIQLGIIAWVLTIKFRK